jgi:hypothetical protein
MSQETNEDLDSKSELKSALQRNRELLERIYDSTEKTRRYLFWIKVLNIIKLIVVVLSFVSVLVYMAPLLKKVLDLYTTGV